MKCVRILGFVLAMCLLLSCGVFASGEPSEEKQATDLEALWAEVVEAPAGMTADEQAWWDGFEIPEGMADITLYPDDQTELRAKNYNTVCRYMQGLSAYLYLLYADDVVTGVAYDFSLTSDSMRNSDIDFQKQLDASNAEGYPDWEWTNIQVYQSDDPNVFLVECDGSGTVTEDGEAVRTHTDHYLHKFTLEDGKIKEYIEFNNPIQELIEMGYEVPTAGGGDLSGEASGEASGETSGEVSADTAETKTVTDGTLTADEQAWWDSFEIPDGMESVELFPDEQLALREANYETVCRFMAGLSPYLYLLYADDIVTGVAYDFGGTTSPFNPIMCSDISMQKSLDASNAETYPDWEYTIFVVYQSDDPNVFLVECDGGGSTSDGGEHHDHYVHEFIMQDGKISQYIEFNSPLNELIEGGYEVPDFHAAG